MNFTQVSTRVRGIASKAVKKVTKKKAMLGSLAALPIVATGTLVNAGVANAVALTGNFQLSSEAFDPATTISITKNTLSFAPNPGRVNLVSQTSSFTSFDTAAIFSTPVLQLGATGTNAKMLDLGTTADIAGSTSDGQNIFSLTKIADAFDIQTFNLGSFTTTAIALAVDGFFTSADGDKSIGSGILTFQIAGKTKAQVEDILNQGKTIDGLAFSGAYISTKSVPEPASILGLGVVAGSLAASRRRKANQPS